MFIVLKFRF